jgi:hypothetical protein
MSRGVCLTRLHDDSASWHDYRLYSYLSLEPKLGGNRPYEHVGARLEQYYSPQAPVSGVHAICDKVEYLGLLRYNALISPNPDDCVG